MANESSVSAILVRLHQDLKTAASQRGESLNSFCVRLLEQAVFGDGGGESQVGDRSTPNADPPSPYLHKIGPMGPIVSNLEENDEC